jgi:hypothetical protein
MVSVNDPAGLFRQPESPALHRHRLPVTSTGETNDGSHGSMPLSPQILSGPTDRAIQWRLVWGVITLQASLQLGWIIYNAYQPILLQRFGFAPLLLLFALLPGLVGLVIEPISGAFSDRRSDDAHGRLLPITIAVAVAGLLFLTTAGLLQRAPAGVGVALPALMVIWMVAVQAASSPNLAQLNEAVSLRSLPKAVALLTLTQGLIGACAASLARGALQLGPAFTFLLGGVVLALGLAVLRAGSGPASPGPRGMAPAAAWPVGALAAGALLLGIALAVGWQLQLLLELLPRLHPQVAAGLPAGGQGSVVLLCSALAAPLIGRAVGRWGWLASLATGIVLLALVLGACLVLPSPWEPLLLPPLGLIHSLVVISLTATALATLGPQGSGLGAGLVLGGSGLAGSLSLLHFGSSGPVRPGELLALLGAATAVALAGCLLLEGLRRRSVAAGSAGI